MKVMLDMATLLSGLVFILCLMNIQRPLQSFRSQEGSGLAEGSYFSRQKNLKLFCLGSLLLFMLCFLFKVLGL